MHDSEDDVALGSAAPDEAEDVEDARGTIETIRERRGPITDALWMVHRQFALAVAIFCLCAVVGYVAIGPVITETVASNPEMPSADCRTPTDSFVADTIGGYFVNNIGVAVVMMGGMGLLTGGAIAYNGVILGAGWQLAVGGMGASDALVAACVGPHGLFEFPGLFLASAIGFFLPWRAFQYFRGHREEIVDPVEEVHVLQLMALVILLILVAAVVEAHGSELVARLLLGPP